MEKFADGSTRAHKSAITVQNHLTRVFAPLTIPADRRPQTADRRPQTALSTLRAQRLSFNNTTTAFAPRTAADEQTRLIRRRRSPVRCNFIYGKPAQIRSIIVFLFSRGITPHVRRNRRREEGGRDEFGFDGHNMVYCPFQVCRRQTCIERQP